MISKSAATPTPELIRSTRAAARLTQTEAAALVHTTCRTWQQWEAGDRAMHPAFWELFALKAGVSYCAPAVSRVGKR